MQELGKTLLILGLALLVTGALLMLFAKTPFVGRLPGDIVIQRKNFTFYFPLATSIVASIILSLILWLWSRR